MVASSSKISKEAQELDKTVKMMKNGNLLSGLHGYFYDTFEPKKLFKMTTKQFDNNIIFFIFTIICLLLSLISVFNNTAISRLGESYEVNKTLLENLLSNHESTQVFSLEFFLNRFAKIYDEVLEKEEASVSLFNALRFRFFAVKNCEYTQTNPIMDPYFQSHMVDL